MRRKDFEKKNNYSIRKLTVGACSVLIGMTIFGNGIVHADEAVHSSSVIDMENSLVSTDSVLSADSSVSTSDELPTVDEKPESDLSTVSDSSVVPVAEDTSNVEVTPESVVDNYTRERSVKEDGVEMSSRTNEAATPSTASLETATAAAENHSNQEVTNQREINFNKDWYFTLNDKDDESGKNVDVKDWSKLDLPHDWSIYFDFNHNSPARNEGGQLDGGTGWYRKTLDVSPENKDKLVRINFDGVYMDSSLYVNGKLVGNYPNGYNHFSYDITDYLTKDGSPNSIAIKAVNHQPSSRWYSGSGVYRDVTLSYTDKVHLVENGNHITSPKLAEQHGGVVDTLVSSKVSNNDNKDYDVYVEHQIFTKEGKAVTDILKSDVKHVGQGETAEFDQNLKVTNPILWSTKTYSPQLYVLMTHIYKNNQLVDSTQDIFGYRYMNWTSKDGFSLNGESLKFHGMAIHHDNGALGSEENYKAIYRKLKLLKDMGVNAIRTSHNPASNDLLQAASELGILVQEEAFDTWYGGKKTYDYGRFFDQDATHPDAKKGEKWSDFDLRKMVEKDKNNPAIIMWSLGNEVEEANGDAKSIATLKRLKADIKAIDTERYVTMGENKYSRGATGNFLKLSALLDAVGMNYGEANYDAVRKAHPDWLIYGSETSSATRTRDSYYDPAHLLVHNNGVNRHYEQSDYGNDYVGWGKTATASWTFDRDRAGYAGQFIWTGIDYIGEPTPWHNMDNTPVKSSYFGIIDTAGIPKNDFYLYMSQWYSSEEKPMVHILPHWNWTEESLKERKILVDGKVPVRTYSNAASVELFLNGQSLGTKTFNVKKTADGRTYQEGAKPSELYLEWLVPYEPGTLKAIARDASGKEIAYDQVATAGTPSSVRLTKEDHVITADGKDLAYIHYEIVDSEGNVVPTANNVVHFNIHGQGKIVGVDNGEEASRERYKAQADGSWVRKAFNGKGIIIVKSTDEEGNFTVYADSEGLSSDNTTVETVSKKDNTFKAFDLKKQTVFQDDVVNLPQTVIAVYGNGKTKEVPVKWTIPDDLSSQKGIKEVIGQAEGIKDPVKLSVQVVGAEEWLPVVQSVPVNPKDEDFNKTVTLVYSDGSYYHYYVEKWILDKPEELKKEGGKTTAHGIVENSDITLEATFIATDKESEPSVSDLTIDGESIKNFKAEKTYYRQMIPYGAELPKVALKSEHYTASVFQADDNNNKTASVYLTDEQGQLASIYHVQFVESAPKLKTLDLLLDKSQDVTEDDVISYHVKGYYEDGSTVVLNPLDVVISESKEDTGHVEIKDGKIYVYNKGHVSLTPTLKETSGVTSSPLQLDIKENKQDKVIKSIRPITLSIDKNQMPILPKEVTVDYDQGLSRTLPVTWDKVDKDSVSYYHTFAVNGHVANTPLKAEAKVTVEGDLVAENIATTVPLGESVTLPGNVRVYHSSGNVVYKDVVWDSIPTEATSKNGIFEVKGQVVGSPLQVSAHIRVSDSVVSGDNISKQWTGSQLPAVIVSNTGGDDSALTLNDLTVSRRNTDPKNRWTTWKTGDKESWAAVLFGNAGDLTKRFVDNLALDFYTDNSIALPETYTIEYYDGQDIPNLPNDVNHAALDKNHPFNRSENWKPVSHLNGPNQLSDSTTNDFTFDKVNTYALRIRMTKPSSSLGVGLTEMTILSHKVPTHSAADVKVIADGNVISNFNKGRKVYYIPEETKTLEAKVTQNGTATLIPSTSKESPIRIVVRAEDGSLINDYYFYKNNELASSYKPLAAENTSQMVKLGETVKLPQTVKVYFHGDKGLETQDLAVNWAMLPENIQQNEGIYRVDGQVEGTDLKAQLQIVVNSDMTSEDTSHSSQVSILVDGKALDGFTADKTDYTYTYEKDIPEIIATTTNNTLVTVVPASQEYPKALIHIVKADGSLAQDYHIEFISKTPSVSTTIPQEGVKELEVVKPELQITKEVIPHNVITKHNAQLNQGQSHIIQKGKDGERLILKEVSTEQGVVKVKELPSVVSEKPLDEIVEIGTKDNLKDLSLSKPSLHPKEQAMNKESSSCKKAVSISNSSYSQKAPLEDTNDEHFSRVAKNNNESRLPDTGDKGTIMLAGILLASLGLGASKLKRKTDRK